MCVCVCVKNLNFVSWFFNIVLCGSILSYLLLKIQIYGARDEPKEIKIEFVDLYYYSNLNDEVVTELLIDFRIWFFIFFFYIKLLQEIFIFFFFNFDLSFSFLPAILVFLFIYSSPAVNSSFIKFIAKFFFFKQTLKRSLYI